MNFIVKICTLYREQYPEYLLIPFFDNAGAHLKKEVISLKIIF